jgi:hypothetical protein
MRDLAAWLCFSTMPGSIGPGMVGRQRLLQIEIQVPLSNPTGCHLPLIIGLCVGRQ